jgi:hypothetical protein
MKRTLVSMILAGLMMSCTTLKGEYPDVQEVLRSMIAAYEMLIADIDNVEKKTDKTGEVKKAIDKFIGRMTALDEQGKRLEMKYPELQNDEKVPKVLKDLENRFVETATCEETKRTAIIILSYVYDPKVKEASDRLTKFLDGN